MPDDVRILRLGDMLFRRKGSFAGRVVHAVISIALRLFFRRIETSRASLVPETGALVFVLNHPNGLIDPALVFCALPRRISFLAKSTLFRLPVIGSMIRALETLPLYRRVDEGEDVTRNRLTFEACHELLRRGRCIALFPEGLSHSAPHLLPVKTGAARIALGAISVGAGVEDTARPLDLKIVPVGLYYTSKTSFRSEALLRFGAPIEVSPVTLDEQNEPPRDEVKQLSARIEAALREVTLNVETEEQLEVATKAEKLFSSIYEGINIEGTLAGRLDFLRRFVAGRGAEETTRAPERIVQLRERILRYEAELRRAGIRPENLSLSRHSRWYVFRHFLLRVAVLLSLFPLAFVGAVLHLPAYLLCTLFARLYPTHGVDDIVSTVKILLAILLMPLTWLVVTGLTFFFWGWRVGLLAFPLVILCGYVAMRSLEEIYDMRGWYKAVRLLLRRRHLFLRLLWERRALHNVIRQLEGNAGD
ncbi:MAG TPA: lysophospholipid acyltransferase family protein [Pyrinomonadaceae bacterium]|jgi:1-acyl-sn-glycerol-3-phosphate acyltransferase|nr:lysophospholipid acyltransferase family protein [Pyrinomonadaceae bacterium]